jgi:hypothetical protein
VQGGAHHIGCFFGQEVAGGQRSAANVAGVLLPDADRFIIAADERLGSPQRQDGAFDLLPGSGGLLVVDQVGAGRRTVIRARARDRTWVGEATESSMTRCSMLAPGPSSGPIKERTQKPGSAAIMCSGTPFGVARKNQW